MENNKSLITRPEVTPTFKSKELNIATKGIYDAAEKVFRTASEGNKRICIILARVERNKAYKEDGFSSLAEYCEKIGFDKSKVHKMENAGRLYDSENDMVKEFANSMGYGNLAILASADEKDIAKAIEDGELSTNSSQDDIASWKRTYNAKNTKERVLPKYKVHIELDNGLTSDYDEIELEMLPELEQAVKVGSFETENKIKWTVYANVYTGGLLKMTAEKIKKESKKAVKSAKNMSREELEARMAEYQKLLAEMDEQ